MANLHSCRLSVYANMITVNKNNGLHFGGRPFLNPSPPHVLITGHTAGNNWSRGSSSQISFEWTRAGSHATGTQVCQQSAMFFFSYSNQGKDRVCFHIRSPTCLTSSMSSLHVWGWVYALLHSKASVPFHWLLYWFVLNTMSIPRLWLYYDKAGYFQYRNVLLTCNKNNTRILTG